MKPWDQRIAKQGDGSDQTTFAAVGKALSMWTQYETNMARLFALLLTSSPTMTVVAPMLALGSIRTFEGRSQMVRTVGDLFFNTHLYMAIRFNDIYLETTKNWQCNFRELMKSGDRFVGRRNEIAHGIVGPIRTSKSGRKIFALQPAYMEASKHIAPMMPKFIYGSTELEFYTKEFEKLSVTTAITAMKLREFLEDIENHLFDK